MFYQRKKVPFFYFKTDTFFPKIQICFMLNMQKKSYFFKILLENLRCFLRCRSKSQKFHRKMLYAEYAKKSYFFKILFENLRCFLRCRSKFQKYYRKMFPKKMKKGTQIYLLDEEKVLLVKKHYFWNAYFT